MNKERASNYELLRIVSIFFIVMYHTIHHGNVINNCLNEGLKVILEFIMLILVVHVNSFVLVTGYFQSKSNFKQSKLWSIINANWFYKALIIIVFFILQIEPITKLDLFINLFPLNLTEYWFINPYLILYCLSPFLNKLINTLDKKSYQKLIIVLLIILSVFPYLTGNLIYQNDGFTLYNFVILYLIGAYLRIYPIKESYIFKRLSNNTFQVLTIVIFFICAFINTSFSRTATTILGINSIFDFLASNIISMTRAYSNPIVIIQSIAFFSFFGTLTIKSKLINKISKLTLGVYFIHDNYYIRRHIYKWIGLDGPLVISYKYVIYIFLATTLIYIGCSIIEWFRQLLFKGISKIKISRKIREKYYNYINNIYITKEEKLIEN